MNFYKIIIAVAIFLVVAILQNIIHECAHILVAKFNGVRVIKIQWFSYSKLLGTRVFFDEEPKICENNIEKKWGWISLAGFIGTTILGYIFTVIGLLYMKYMTNLLIAIVCVFSLIFLTFDPLYFVFGSIFNFGDVVGFKSAFRVKKSISVLFSMLVLLLNILLIRLVWYSL